MDAVGFIVPPAGADAGAGAGAFTNVQLRDAVYHGCGLQNVSKPGVLFDSATEFEKAYTDKPMMWYAGIEVSDAATATAQTTAFTLLHNETLDSGRYVPNYDEDDAKNNVLTLLYPNFKFLPVLQPKVGHSISGQSSC